MRRPTRPVLEALDRKMLPSVAPSTPAGLVVSLKAEVHKDARGAEVAASLTLRNTTRHAITVDDGPSLEGFSATQAGRTVWRSGEGTMTPNFVWVEVLPPHRSLTIKATWDGLADQGEPVAGPTTISGELTGAEAKAIVILPHSRASAKGTA